MKYYFLPRLLDVLSRMWTPLNPKKLSAAKKSVEGKTVNKILQTNKIKFSGESNIFMEL